MKTAAVLAILLLAACATGPVPLPPPDADVRPVTVRDDLNGRWSIVTIGGTPVSGMSLAFAGTTLRAALACNGGGGTISRNGDKLFLDRLALTERACEPARMALDEQVAAILRLPVTMEFTPPGRLRLINEAGSLDLIRQGG